ncbi:carboxymuconolactone decarboxylase family protein [Nemorincola caseinilytica]|uniref:Carboxymuconolactone decarboxylase family protein n=1 Tax=Nemorincola caseinilytica TaxID=2054315 RepID=A0ABP8NM22_9BACT
MSNRINIAHEAPEAYKAMMGLSKFVEATQIPHLQRELIKIRASQMNGCAFCIDMHTKDARKYGETEQRIYLLNAWRETDLYTEEERCILAMTEEITLVSERGLTEETYTWATRLFEATYIAQIIMTIVTINAWNRIAAPTHLPILHTA